MDRHDKSCSCITCLTNEVLRVKGGADNGDPSSVDSVLTERGARYGKFKRHAEITQHLQALIFMYKDRDSYDYDQVEALQMICHKLGRIINGDENYVDSWVDIAGYAQLVADRLRGVSR